MVNDWLKLGGAGAALAYFGGAELPAWSSLAVSALVIAGVAALFATGKINDLLPDPPRVRIVQVNANNDEPMACWSLSPDTFAETQVEWGPLYPHQKAEGEVYEAYAFDPGRNVAVGTWRRSIPGSSLVGRHDTDEVLDVIGEYRGDLEPAARRGESLRQALPAIVRRVKFDTMESQNAALDPSKPMVTDQPSVDEIITAELPDELRPGRLRNGDLRDLLDAAAEDDGDDWGDGMGMVFDDDLPDDALEPRDPLLNDGGSA
ncbi:MULTISPECIES: hypothetical protein [Halobacteriales]|uniref:DUF8125 domain-containing protein n=10 Tax=Halobacteriales TaxID=2235 RepID=M0C1V3_9EURY|nr:MULTISPECIES: hypothetical protein [Halobacteria]ELZ03937.1 hypothetical protein C482_03679 [Natrialba chahannaoensis JCM 10990]ELZ16317.1 hypothetical protein C476_17117 [Natrinema limicola JCM 13563]ELZ38667.1 hypothetical protein C473_00042 [Halorubrum terrestre JCM 10247]ELZ68020.1 hypothetical protein C457_11541 [Haloferax prahovense DSM 18310]ELZ89996.1 hypothetical protein C452_11043 [Haloferax alexandrinus JCM 10717]